MAIRPRAIFMGTPEFAATILGRLLAPDSPVEIVAVVTQADKPAGRGKQMAPRPVKELAAAHGIPVLQPLSLRRPAAVAALQRLTYDLGIVAAYGQILRPEVLGIPPRGYLNVHASVLPKWRGPWPIGATILAGDATTGVSIMRLDEGMDTGPVLTTRDEPIRPDDTTGTLEARLAALGAKVLAETIPGYVRGGISPVPQDDRAATYCHRVRTADARLDWSRPAAHLERLVRAMQPQPVAWTTWKGKQLRVLKAHVVPPDDEKGRGDGREPGTVVAARKNAAVVTGDGLLALDEVQLEGRGPVPIASFLNGYRGLAGSQLGASQAA